MNRLNVSRLWFMSHRKWVNNQKQHKNICSKYLHTSPEAWNTHTHTHTPLITPCESDWKTEREKRWEKVPYKLLHTFLHRPAAESQSHPEGFVWRSPERPSSHKHTQQCSDHVCVCVCVCAHCCRKTDTHSLAL